MNNIYLFSMNRTFYGTAVQNQFLSEQVVQCLYLIALSKTTSKNTAEEAVMTLLQKLKKAKKILPFTTKVAVFCGYLFYSAQTKRDALNYHGIKLMKQPAYVKRNGIENSKRLLLLLADQAEHLILVEINRAKPFYSICFNINLRRSLWQKKMSFIPIPFLIFASQLNMEYLTNNEVKNKSFVEEKCPAIKNDREEKKLPAKKIRPRQYKSNSHRQPVQGDSNYLASDPTGLQLDSISAIVYLDTINVKASIKYPDILILDPELEYEKDDEQIGDKKIDP